MSNIEHINLIDGMNIQPIPLSAGNEITTTEWLMAIQDKVNKIIDMGNAWEKNANEYSDNNRAEIQKEIDDLMKMVDNGDIIKPKSITADKIDDNFLDTFNNFIINKVYEATKFVFFGLEKDYFCAYFPDSFNDTTFSTDDEGRLCLEY